MLRPAGDLGPDPHSLELARQDLAEIRDQGLALVSLAEDALGDLVVRLRFQVAEGEVFQLPLDLADAEPVRQRSVDVERLAGDLAPLQVWERVEGSHVVQAIGELDEDDPEVLRHGDHHLADVFGLLLLVGPQ